MKKSLCICLGLVLAIRLSAAATNAIPQPQLLHAKGIENFYQLSSRIFSGSAPDGEQGFAELRKLGIKTIITVDGSKPDVETAKKFGLRYVHLPIGYDGVPVEQGKKLVKAAETLPQPIFVHCHHGLHRGPAGAAVICEGMENWTPQAAVDWLKEAGTATNYAGLYKSVAQFHPPSAEELKKLPDDFPEITDISPLGDTMVEIDGRLDNLKLIQKSGFKQPPTHPDLDPAQEALLLDELFKELLRSTVTQKRDQDFQSRLADMEKAVNQLHLILDKTPLEKSSAEAALKNIVDTCAACHKAHRN